MRVGREFGADALLSCDPRGKGTMFYDRVSDDNIPLQKYFAWSRTFHGDEAEDAVHHVENLEDVLGRNGNSSHHIFGNFRADGASRNGFAR